jgi:hypothetical protein
MFTLFFLSIRVFLCHFKVFFTIYFTSLGGPGLQGGPGDMAKAAPRLSGSTSATVKILAQCGPGAHHGGHHEGHWNPLKCTFCGVPFPALDAHTYMTHTHIYIYILYNISGYVYIYINPHPELLRCQILFVIVYHLQSWYQMPHSWWLYETLRKTKETMNHCGFSWHISAGGTSPKRNDGMWNQQKRQHFKTEIEKHSILSTSIIYPSFHWST